MDYELFCIIVILLWDFYFSKKIVVKTSIVGKMSPRYFLDGKKRRTKFLNSKRHIVKRDLDPQEQKLAALLMQDGTSSVTELARGLDVTAPTVRTRLKSMLAEGLLKIVGMVDPSKVKGLTVALVCLTVSHHEQLGNTLERVAALPRVHWAGVVTGRYDIVAEVILSEDIDDLYRFMDHDLSQVGGIASTESFVVMRSRGKWICLPDGVFTDA